MKFRKDINGLRAIAVIAVVLFHFNDSWMPGGFAGVDVFFVISGFLMTGIIFRGIEQENLSILKFYMARANRIIPALALLCLVLIVLGWFYLTPLEYGILGKHATSSVTFISNFIYWREAGYFDAASHKKWLLHSWSLSVEWQFYIIYPLLLVAMRKFISIKAMKLVLVVVTALGFILCVIVSYKYPNAAYYLLPTRAWEMTIGGIAYLYPFAIPERRKKIVEWLGLALIIGSYFLMSENNPWPGYLALFPVVGSFLILQAQRNDSIFTSNVISQKLGSWSYSIYLWHWPLVVIIYTFSLPEYYAYLFIPLAILFGFLSYKYVEKIKFRNDFSSLFSYFKSKPIYIAGMIAVLGSLLFLKYETLTPYRLSAEQIPIVEQLQRNPREVSCGKVEDGVSAGCTYGKGPIKALVIGDSHANAQMVSIGDRAALNNGSILALGFDLCLSVKDSYRVDDNGKNPKYDCGKLVANTIEMAAEKYPEVPVIIINRVSLYLFGNNEDKYIPPPAFFVDEVFSKRDESYFNNLTGHMVDTICEISKNNPVYLVRPIPELKKNVPMTMFNTLTVSGKVQPVKITRSDYDQRQILAFAMQDRAVAQCGAKILDPIPYLCDSDYCYGDSKDIPLYFDDNHLSGYGAKVISPIYNEVFKK